jgi:predicted DNA-binding transcriptional regulator AlpA
MNQELETKKEGLFGSKEPYIKPEELATLLNVKVQTIGDWARRHPTFPCIILPGSIRCRFSEVEAWLKQMTTEHKEANQKK